MKYIHAYLASIWLLFAKLLPKKEGEKEFTPFLPLNLQFFSDDDLVDPPTDPPADPPGDDKKFNQDDVNKIIQKRVSQAEKNAQKALAKTLGYDSVEAMSAALNKDKNADNKDNPVDVDALVDAKLKEQLKAEQDKTFKRLVNSEVKVFANELGFADWEDALALSDLSQVKEDGNGNILGVQEALKALVDKKPHLVKQAPSSRFGVDVPNHGGGSRPVEGYDAGKSIAELRNKKGVK